MERKEHSERGGEMAAAVGDYLVCMSGMHVMSGLALTAADVVLLYEPGEEEAIRHQAMTRETKHGIIPRKESLRRYGGSLGTSSPSHMRVHRTLSTLHCCRVLHFAPYHFTRPTAKTLII
ncbi:unnamed protein product [Calypogeia fissa]